MKARLAEWGATALPGSPADFGKLPFQISSHVLRHSCGYKQFPDVHIYHYAPYEPAALKRLMGRYATRENELDRTPSYLLPGGGYLKSNHFNGGGSICAAVGGDPAGASVCERALTIRARVATPASAATAVCSKCDVMDL